jgi:hypothetical protein
MPETERKASETDAEDLQGNAAGEALRKECERIMALEPEADPENIRHTLLLLNIAPIERLRRSLLRGRGLRANRL